MATSSDSAGAGTPIQARQWARQWARRTLVAVTLLALLEAYWASRLELSLGLAAVASGWTMLTALVVSAEAASLALAALCRRLWSRHSGWLVVALLSPWAWLTAASLLSGKRISAEAGVVLMKVGLALALVLAGRFAVAMAVEIARRPKGAVRLGWTLITGVALIGGSWADNRVHVGLYPAFHLVLGSVVLGAAVLLALLWCPVERLRWRPVPSAAVLLFCALVPWWGADADADTLVSFTNGLLPKARQGAVLLSDWVTVPADDRHVDGRRSVVVASPPPRNLLADPTALDGEAWSGSRNWTAVGPGRWAIDGGGATAHQLLARDALVGQPLAASVRVRLVSAAAGESSEVATVTLALDDPGRPARRQLSQPLSYEWVELALTLADTTAPERSDLPATERDEHALDPLSISPEIGVAWKVPVPLRWHELANNAQLPQGSQPLMLLEDGRELGPVCPMHRTIREVGGGLYSHWSDQLIFSTSDGSDPRSNGRQYSLVDPAYLTAASHDPGLLLELTVEGLSAAAELEIADFSAVAVLPEDPRRLALSLAGEFAFTPTAAAGIAGLRSATHNVILVVLDALRDDHVGPGADGVSLTPRIDALAAEGLRFTTTYSPSDYTGRSVPCLVTGLPLQVTLAAADHGLPLPTFLDRLGAVGLETYSNGSDYVLHKFRHLLIGPWFGAAQHGSNEQKSEHLAEEVLTFVEAQQGEPFAVYTHWSYAHVPRSRNMVDDYAREVAHADDKVGLLIDGLRAAGVWDSTLLIITADHGYGLGEGFRFLGAQGCGERSLRVPLIMHVPGLQPPGTQVAEVVSLLAVVPSVLDLLAPEAQGLMADRSLFSLVLDAADPRRFSGGTAFSDMGSSFMTRSGGYKLAEDDSLRTAMVFDSVADPEERTPLLDTARRIQLQRVRDAEWARQARLSQALIAAQVDGVAPEALLAFQVRRGAAADVGSLLRRLWLYNAATRTFLLDQILRRGLRDQGAALDSLVRESFDAEDQQLLVMRGWCSASGALAELETQYSQLGPAARLLLADLALEMDFSEAPGLLDQIEADALALWSAGVGLESLEERRVALGLTAAAAHQPVERLGPVKDALVELFNRWMVAVDPGPYFSCLRMRRFTAVRLLDVFRDKPVPEDLGRAETLLRNRYFAARIPEMCRRLDSDQARSWLLDELAHWSVRDEKPPGKFLFLVVPVLRNFADAEFRRRADETIQARFPSVQLVEQ